MHEEPIKFVLFEKELDQFLTILFTAERRLDIEKWML